MGAWHEDDSFWETFGPYLFTDERRQVAAAEVDGLLAYLAVQPGSSVLDLGCGVGRHSIELARRGFVVTAVDRTEVFLNQARRRAEAAGVEIEFVQSDMREFRGTSAFDGAINLFTTFGYFENPEDDLKVARNLFESLRKTARLVIDVMGKEVLARRFRERDWHRFPDGAILLEERKLRSGWDWLENRWTLVRGSERFESLLSHRIYSGAELARLLRDAGFMSVALYGSFGGAPYDHHAERLVAVAMR